MRKVFADISGICINPFLPDGESIWIIKYLDKEKVEIKWDRSEVQFIGTASEDIIKAATESKKYDTENIQRIMYIIERPVGLL